MRFVQRAVTPGARTAEKLPSVIAGRLQRFAQRRRCSGRAAADGSPGLRRWDVVHHEYAVQNARAAEQLAERLVNRVRQVGVAGGSTRERE